MLTVPALTVMASFGLEYLSQMFKLRALPRATIMMAVIAATLVIAKPQWHINQPDYAREVPGDALEGTTTWADEQATQWLVPKPKTIPAQKIELRDIQQNALAQNAQSQFSVTTWKTQLHRYTIDTPIPTTVVEHTMYYPGWRVWVDGQETQIDYRDAKNPGEIVFALPAGEHKVVARLTETPLRITVDLVSILTMAIVIGKLVRNYKPA